MPGTEKLYTDFWWRFTSYEIRDGFIVPSAGASLVPYEPWKKYGPPRGKGSVLRPYCSLIELLGVFEGHKRLERLTAPQESSILRWCNSNGLLGILLHQVEIVRQRSTGLRKATEYPSGREKAFAVGRRHYYYRTAGGWLARTEETIIGRPQPLTPEALVRKLGTFEKDWEPLSTTWERFFPSVKESKRDKYLYPVPTSEEFWGIYAEPVVLFLDAVLLLCQAVEDLRSIRFSEKTKGWSRRRWLKAHGAMQSLTSTVVPTLYPRSKGGYSVGWACQSLLSTLAMMATLDLAQARVLSCRRCETVFVSQAKQAQYCSVRCRNAEQMKRYRHSLEKATTPRRKNDAKTRST